MDEQRPGETERQDRAQSVIILDSRLEAITSLGLVQRHQQPGKVTKSSRGTADKRTGTRKATRGHVQASPQSRPGSLKGAEVTRLSKKPIGRWPRMLRLGAGKALTQTPVWPGGSVKGTSPLHSGFGRASHNFVVLHRAPS